MCNFARRTGARPRPSRPLAPVPQAGETLRRRGLPAPGAQGWGWGARCALENQGRGLPSSDLTSRCRTWRIPRHLLRPPPAVPWSPASGPRKTTRSLYPSRRPSPEGTRGGGRRGRAEEWDVKRLSQPSRSPPPPQLGSRHVVPGVGGGEKGGDFWVLGIASSSFILRRQLQRLRALPGSSSQRSGDPRPEPRLGKDAEAAGGTCGSSRRRRSPRRRQSEPRQPQPLRPGQPPPRSQLLMRLLAPAPRLREDVGPRRRSNFCGLFLLQGKKTKRSVVRPGAHTLHAPTTGPVLLWVCPAGVWLRRGCSRGARWEGLQIPRCRRGGSGGLVGLWLQMVGLRGRKKLG